MEKLTAGAAAIIAALGTMNYGCNRHMTVAERERAKSITGQGFRGADDLITFDWGKKVKPIAERERGTPERSR